MAVSLTGTRTVAKDVSPTMTAAQLTVIMALAPEQLTVAQLDTLHGAIKHVGNLSESTVTLGTMFP
jgi:hypothetical protein